MLLQQLQCSAAIATTVRYYCYCGNCLGAGASHSLWLSCWPALHAHHQADSVPVVLIVLATATVAPTNMLVMFVVNIGHHHCEHRPDYVFNSAVFYAEVREARKPGHGGGACGEQRLQGSWVVGF